MPWLNRRWISVFALSASIMIIVISVVGWRNYDAGVNSRNKFNAYGVDEASLDSKNYFSNWTLSYPALGAIINFDSFDPSSTSGGALGFRILLQPINALVALNGVWLAPQYQVSLVLDGVTSDFPANKSMAAQTVNRMLDGDINGYPFDKYSAEYFIVAYASDDTYSLPLTVFSQGAIQGFVIDTAFQGIANDGSMLRVTFSVRRSPTTKTFAIIIFLVMWGLSLSIFAATISVWFMEMDVKLSLIAISTGLLFALPSIRNSQPGVPITAGTTSDMVGFFWNILLVTISAIYLLINWIVQSTRARPAKPATRDSEADRRHIEHIPLLTKE